MSQPQTFFQEYRGKPVKEEESEVSESRVVDYEVLIRQAFDRSVREGYELLFRRYYRPLCNHAVRFVQSKEQAEDLVCEVFSSFWKGQQHLHITTSMRAYLFRSLRNRIYNHVRNELTHQHPLITLPETLAEPEDPQQILQYTELYNKVQATVKALPPQCQRVFLMSRFENRKNREIAEELSISLKAVEMHITKALNLLRTALFSLSVLLTPLLHGLFQ